MDVVVTLVRLQIATDGTVPPLFQSTTEADTGWDVVIISQTA